MDKPFPFTVCKECASGSGGGTDGLSAYEIAVKNGFKGSEEEWLESLKAEITEEDKAEIIKAVDEAHAHRCIPADGELLIKKKFSHTIPANDWVIIDEDGDISKYGIETCEQQITEPEFVGYTHFKVVWNGTEYNVSDSDVSGDVALYLTDTKTGNHVQIYTYSYGNGIWGFMVSLPYAKSIPTEPITLEIIPATGSLEEHVIQLDKKYIPDYISKTEVTEMVGDIDTALDAIIAMQNELMGGDAE